MAQGVYPATDGRLLAADIRPTYGPAAREVSMIEPIGTRIAIQPDREHQTVSGLFIPETAAGEAVRRGTVVAAGPGALGTNGSWYDTQCVPGDVVWYRYHRATEVKRDGEELHLIHEGDCLCIERTGAETQ